MPAERNRGGGMQLHRLAGEEPQEGVHWQKGANFGKPTSVDAYQLPRTYKVSLGVRF